MLSKNHPKKIALSLPQKIVLGIDWIIGLLLLIGSLYVLFITITTVNLLPFSSTVLPLLIPLGIATLIGFLSYKLFMFRTSGILIINVLVIHLLFWALLYFIGFYFASTLLFPIIIIILSLLFIYPLFRNKDLKVLTTVLFVVSILMGILTIQNGFEEDYCQAKGDEAAKNGSIMVIATKEDQEWDSEVIPGKTEIGRGWQAHMRCHQHFNFGKAIQEKYHL